MSLFNNSKGNQNGVNKRVDSACGSRRKYNRFGLVWVFCAIYKFHIPIAVTEVKNKND